ncbi:hypothetical protein [Streptomyces sp. NPDC090445]|uniref:hypothetical protein n=1 Tax=Streptomyces sp. NPDC090445 TaxID=3365963 RepID=UPI00381DE7F8
MSWTENGVSAGNTNNIGSVKLGRNDAAATSGVGIIAAGSSVCPVGRLTAGGTAGTLQLRWAQTASSATPTIIKTGSWLRLTRIVWPFAPSPACGPREGAISCVASQRCRQPCFACGEPIGPGAVYRGVVIGHDGGLVLDADVWACGPQAGR